MSEEHSWKITPLFSRLSESDLVEFESSFSFSLPEDYKCFLLAYNGGFPSPQQLDIPNTKHSLLIDILYGLGNERIPGDLVYEINRRRRDLPEGFLPVGHDPGGSPFLLATLGEERGRVFFWDRTWFFKESSATENTYWLADSFKAFLDSLYEAE